MIAADTYQIFKTDKGSVIQDDARNRFIVRFQGKEVAFSPCQFLNLKRHLESVDWENIFLTDAPGTDIHILNHGESLLVLTLCEFIGLRELVRGSMAMLELQIIIHQRLNHAIL